MEQVDVSVTVCTFNRAEMLARALGSLICQETDGGFSFEIVVVDDGSTDRTGDVVKKAAARSQVPVRYVRKEGGGVAAARNTGVAEARGTRIAFFDDDQLAEKAWLKNLLAVALQAGADCVGGTILLDLPREQGLRLGRVCREMLGEFIWRNNPGVYRGNNLPGTGNILISRQVFDSIGLFDTSLLSGGEDYDLVKRMRAAGYDIWTAPDSVVHHLIPKYRLSLAYFRWVALRLGASLALMNRKQFGYGRTLVLCVARIGQALLVNVPRLLLAHLRRNKGEATDCKCLLWRAAGYAHCALHLLAPEMFAQDGFLGRINFRRERSAIAQFEGPLRRGPADTGG